MDRKRQQAPAAPRTFSNTKSSVVLFPGNGIAGDITFDQEHATQIVDELTARRNVAEYTSFVNSQRFDRQKTWSKYWERKAGMAKRVLQLEREAYAEGAAAYTKSGFDDDVHAVPASLPIVEPTLGYFDQPRPEPFTIPDPPGVAANRG